MSGSPGSRVLVAGMGDEHAGDAGFGVAVARALESESLPPGARVVAYGARHLELALDLLAPPDLLIVVETANRGEDAGTLHLIDPEAGGAVPRTFVVACEPETVERGSGLSEPVRGAVNRAVTMIRELIAQQIHRLGTSDYPEPKASSIQLAAGSVAIPSCENPGSTTSVRPV